MLMKTQVMQNVLYRIEHMKIIDINVILIGIIILINIFFMGLYWKDLKNNKYMPWALHITNRLYYKGKLSNKVKERLVKLHVCDSLEEAIKKYYYKLVSMIIIIFIGINIISILVIHNEEKEPNLISTQTIKRPSYGEDSKTVDLNVEFKDNNGDRIKSNIDIDIEPNRLNKEEEKKLIIKVKKYIRKNVLGQNEKYGNITKKINLMSSYKKDKKIKISWQLDEYGLISSSGEIQYENVKNKDINKGIDIVIIARINYFENQYEYPIYMTVKKKKLKKEDMYTNELAVSIDKLNKKYSENGIIKLPEKIKNKKVTYREEKSNNISNWIMIIIIGLVLIIIIINGMIRDLDKEIDNKNTMLLMYYCEIINKIQLLLSAGLNIVAAWEKICTDYVVNREKKGKVNYAYEEMLYTYKRINMGMPQIEEFEEFGRRIGLPQYIKLSSLILQCIKIGSEDFIDTLELEEQTIQCEKKELYIRQGEKLGSSLLVPMIIMMVITMIIVVVPAFMSM